MAHSASIHSRSISMVVHHLRDSFVVHQPSPTSPIFPRQPLSLPRSFVLYARRKKTSAITTSRFSSKNSKKKKQTLTRNDDSEDDDLEGDDSGNDNDDLEEDDSDDDAFEELFRQLEEDLKNDDGTLGDDDEITEEDAAKLERELANALGEDDAGYIIGDDDVDEDEDEDNNDEEEEEDEDGDEDEGPKVLRNWQLKRLAAALKVGRRKIGIKNLAAELCLDRALVLQLLREPPPKLLMMSLALPNEPAPTDLAPANNPTVVEPDHRYNFDEGKSVEPVKSEKEENMPIHLLQQKWYARKRLKKAQVETLEKVYRRSKRPTDAIISSIVHVTNLPRRKVIKWFEDKRAEDGVQPQRRPYQNSIR